MNRVFGNLILLALVGSFITSISSETTVYQTTMAPNWTPRDGFSLPNGTSIVLVNEQESWLDGIVFGSAKIVYTTSQISLNGVVYYPGATVTSDIGVKIGVSSLVPLVQKIVDTESDTFRSQCGFFGFWPLEYPANQAFFNLILKTEFPFGIPSIETHLFDFYINTTDVHPSVSIYLHTILLPESLSGLTIFIEAPLSPSGYPLSFYGSIEMLLAKPFGLEFLTISPGGSAQLVMQNKSEITEFTLTSKAIMVFGPASFSSSSWLSLLNTFQDFIFSTTLSSGISLSDMVVAISKTGYDVSILNELIAETVSLTLSSVNQGNTKRGLTITTASTLLKGGGTLTNKLSKIGIDDLSITFSLSVFVDSFDPSSEISITLSANSKIECVQLSFEIIIQSGDPSVSLSSECHWGSGSSLPSLNLSTILAILFLFTVVAI